MWKLTWVWPSLCCACIVPLCAVNALSCKNKFQWLKWENFLWMGSAQCAVHGLKIHEKQNHLEFHKDLRLSILLCPCASSNKLDFLSFFLTRDHNSLEPPAAKQNYVWDYCLKSECILECCSEGNAEPRLSLITHSFSNYRCKIQFWGYRNVFSWVTVYVCTF